MTIELRDIDITPEGERCEDNQFSFRPDEYITDWGTIVEDVTDYLKKTCELVECKWNDGDRDRIDIKIIYPKQLRMELTNCDVVPMGAFKVEIEDFELRVGFERVVQIGERVIADYHVEMR